MSPKEVMAKRNNVKERLYVCWYCCLSDVHGVSYMPLFNYFVTKITLIQENVPFEPYPYKQWAVVREAFWDSNGTCDN